MFKINNLKFFILVTLFIFPLISNAKTKNDFHKEQMVLKIKAHGHSAQTQTIFLPSPKPVHQFGFQESDLKLDDDGVVFSFLPKFCYKMTDHFLPIYTVKGVHYSILAYRPYTLSSTDLDLMGLEDQLLKSNLYLNHRNCNTTSKMKRCPTRWEFRSKVTGVYNVNYRRFNKLKVDIIDSNKTLGCVDYALTYIVEDPKHLRRNFILNLSPQILLGDANKNLYNISDQSYAIHQGVIDEEIIKHFLKLKKLRAPSSIKEVKVKVYSNGSGLSSKNNNLNYVNSTDLKIEKKYIINKNSDVSDTNKDSSNNKQANSLGANEGHNTQSVGQQYGNSKGTILFGKSNPKPKKSYLYIIAEKIIQILLVVFFLSALIK